MLALVLLAVACALATPVRCPTELSAHFSDTGCRTHSDYSFSCPSRLAPFDTLPQNSFKFLRNRIIHALDGNSGAACCLNSDILEGAPIFCASSMLPNQPTSIRCPSEMPPHYSETGCTINQGDASFSCAKRLPPFDALPRSSFRFVRSRILHALDGGNGAACCVSAATTAVDLSGASIFCASLSLSNASAATTAPSTVAETTAPTIPASVGAPSVRCPADLPPQLSDTGCRVTDNFTFSCPSRLAPFDRLNAASFRFLRSRIINSLDGNTGSSCCVNSQAIALEGAPIFCMSMSTPESIVPHADGSVRCPAQIPNFFDTGCRIGTDNTFSCPQPLAPFDTLPKKSFRFVRSRILHALEGNVGAACCVNAPASEGLLGAALMCASLSQPAAAQTPVFTPPRVPDVAPPASVDETTTSTSASSDASTSSAAATSADASTDATTTASDATTAPSRFVGTFRDGEKRIAIVQRGTSADQFIAFLALTNRQGVTVRAHGNGRRDGSSLIIEIANKTTKATYCTLRAAYQGAHLTVSQEGTCFGPDVMADGLYRHADASEPTTTAPVADPSTPATTDIEGVWTSRFNKIRITRSPDTHNRTRVTVDMTLRNAAGKIGDVSGPATFSNNQLIFNPDEFSNCRFFGILSGDVLSITQAGTALECGFQDAVFADGRYRK